jgi:filamin
MTSFDEDFYSNYKHNGFSNNSILTKRLQNLRMKNGSPIDFNVAVDTSQVAIDIEKCKSVLINQVCSFIVDTKDNNHQGNIKVVVTNPDGNQIQAKSINNQDSTWKIEFNPTEIGEYFIEVFYANQLIAGSPFKCNVFDPSQIKVVPCLNGIVNQSSKFEVDASQAGTGQLEIAIENGRIPCTFSNQGNLCFIPSFTPFEAGRHEVTVKFNSYEVPGSPFYCHVVDVNKITLVGLDENLFAIYKSGSFALNINELSSDDINIKMTSPSRLNVPVSRFVTPQNTMKLSFQPQEIGTHYLDIDYASVPISGSPFEIKVFDSNRVVVSEVNGSEMNKQCELTIDASGAGEGQLEISINDGQVKNHVKQLKPGQYSVTFLPQKQDNYVIDIKFNQQEVPGCPKRVFIKDNQNVRLCGKIMENVLVCTPNSFHMEGFHSLSDISIRIKSPSDQEFVPKVSQTKSDECRVEWTPYELGTYTITAHYCDHLVKGTPLKIKTYDPKRVQVFEILDGVVNQETKFIVDASQSGEGSLEIGISCNGHYIPNQVKPIGNSRFEVHFTPAEATNHIINIHFNGGAVTGSPFKVKVIDANAITAQGKGLGLIPVNKPTTFQVLTGNAGVDKVHSVVTGPKDENVFVRLYQQSNGDYIGEFTPLIEGRHRVEIFYANQPVAGSPFKAMAYDIRTAEVTKLPKELINGAENWMEVDLAKLSDIKFDINVKAPSGRQLPVHCEGKNYKKIRIVPHEIGPHRIDILIGDEHIPGSPFTINSIDARLPTAHGNGLHHGLEDRQAEFLIESQGLTGNLDVKIEGPQHFTKNQIELQNDGSYLVKYTPVEVGQFKIHCKWNDREIPGSPFISYVVNPEKVKVVGGWQSILDQSNTLMLKLYEEKTINFDTSEAGPGTLNASILAPNGTKLPLRLTSQAQMYSLSFSALYEGEYKIHLMWDNYQLPNSPIIAKTSQQSDMNKIEVNGNGLSEAKINQESEFVIDGSRAGEIYGLPEVRLSGTRCDIEVRIMQLGHNIYKCTYVPQVPGAYLLNIKWNDRQIGSSPYKVTVGMNSDPNKVSVGSEGIKGGVFGSEIKTVIDTRRAGPGELTAHCMGPTKVAFCEFYDHKDGTFTLYVRPQEPGKHILQIKYNDEHVPGSPYVMRVSGAPDASKVKVIGPGIHDGVLNKFKSRFICETKGAGAGQLTVRIRGPKGAFRVEMQRETQKERTILCKYDPVEAGDYQVNVKWSGTHVPGSPFNVHVHKSEEEFKKFLKNNPDIAFELQQLSIQHQALNI